MTTKNHKCRGCGYNYHHCSSCDPTGIPWEVDDFCSGDCYYGWAQSEIERLRAERDTLCRAVWELSEEEVVAISLDDTLDEIRLCNRLAKIAKNF